MNESVVECVEDVQEQSLPELAELTFFSGSSCMCIDLIEKSSPVCLA